VAALSTRGIKRLPVSIRSPPETLLGDKVIEPAYHNCYRYKEKFVILQSIGKGHNKSYLISGHLATHISENSIYKDYH